MIEKSTIDRIMSVQNIVDVIGDFYELKKAGKEYQCLCPFHGDRHLGSFMVSPSKNMFKCFSCGIAGDSIDFLQQHERLSYPDAIRWLGRKYGIDVEGSERFTPKPSKPRPPQQKVEDLPMLVIPSSYMTHTRGDALDNDLFCNWLRSVPWRKEQKPRVEMVLKNYAVGHAKDGRVIFWQIDEQQQVRTGKMMKYMEDGHRDKSRNPSWIHNYLERAGYINLEKVQKVSTLFGMHLLGFFPNADVCLVESEKTALICAIAYGEMSKHIWMACGGLNFLKPDMIQPLVKAGKHITLFPDRDGQEKWKDVALSLGYSNISINTDFVTKWWKPEDGEKADIADVLLRILREAKTKAPIDQMREMNATLNNLIDKFDLIER